MDFLTLAYGMTGFICGIAFLPQITALISDRTGARSTSLTSVSIFTLCSLITLLYSTERGMDNCFVFCSAVGLLGNIAVLGLAILRRWQLHGPEFVGRLQAVRVRVRTSRVH